MGQKSIVSPAVGNFHSRSTSTYHCGSLSRLYNEDSDKYSGLTTDDFEPTLALLDERCEQSGVSKDDKHNAFSLMLSGSALAFYIESLQGRVLTFDEMTHLFQTRFNTAEQKRSLVREWEKSPYNRL